MQLTVTVQDADYISSLTHANVSPAYKTSLLLEHKPVFHYNNGIWGPIYKFLNESFGEQTRKTWQKMSGGHIISNDVQVGLMMKLIFDGRPVFRDIDELHFILQPDIS